MRQHRGGNQDVMSYRWNDDLQRVEYLHEDLYWTPSVARSMSELSPATPTLPYDDTWCEPTEEIVWW